MEIHAPAAKTASGVYEAANFGEPEGISHPLSIPSTTTCRPWLEPCHRVEYVVRETTRSIATVFWTGLATNTHPEVFPFTMVDARLTDIVIESPVGPGAYNTCAFSPVAKLPL